MGLRGDRRAAGRKAKAIRFSTLDAICRALDCNVEDILEYKEDL